MDKSAAEAYKPVLSVVNDGVARREEVTRLSFDKMFPEKKINKMKQKSSM